MGFNSRNSESYIFLWSAIATVQREAFSFNPARHMGAHKTFRQREIVLFLVTTSP
jgi:hypothetical protein